MPAPPTTDLGKWRSVELECVFRTINDFNTFNHWAACLDVKERGFVEIHHDGSIDSGITINGTPILGVPREVVVTFKIGKEGEKFLKKICKALNKHAQVNSSCGTHVHFDMRHVGQEEAILYAAKVSIAVSALKLMLPRSRRSNHYCSQTTSLVTGDRYSFVNWESYHKYKTIEIRGHSGTLQAEKIINWTKIIERIMYNKSMKPVGSIGSLVKEYKLPKKLAAYAVARGRQFRGNDAQEVI